MKMFKLTLIFCVALLLLTSNALKAASFPITTTQCNRIDFNMKAGLFDDAISPTLITEANLYDYFASQSSDNAELINSTADLIANGLALMDVSKADYTKLSKTETLQMGGDGIISFMSRFDDNLPDSLYVVKIVLEQSIAAVKDLAPPRSIRGIAEKAAEQSLRVTAVHQLFKSLDHSLRRAETHGIRIAMQSYFKHCSKPAKMVEDTSIPIDEYSQCRINHEQTHPISCAAYVYAKQQFARFYHPSPNMNDIDTNVRANLQLINNIYSNRYQRLSASQKQDTPVRISPFNDIPPNAYFARFLKPLRQLNIIHGHPDGQFRPNKTVNRAEFLKMLIKSHQLHYIPTLDISVPASYDSHKTQWYYQYLELAFNITNKNNHNEAIAYWDSPPSFSQPITRQEVVRMIANSLDLAHYTGAEQIYSDVPPSSEFYPWIMALHHNTGLNEYGKSTAVITGFQDQTFKPTRTITRAEVATLLFKAYRVSYILGAYND